MNATKPITIIPIEARKNDYFTQTCETCEALLEIGTFIIAIKVRRIGYEANLFLGCKLDCPTCNQANVVIKVFDDEDETCAEMNILAEDIRNSKGIIRGTMIPDISQKDINEIFEN